MKIFINDTEIEIFSGARVRDALLKYSKKEFQAIIQGKKKVVDKHRNPIDPEGELSDAQQLYITGVNWET
ncbi:MAG: hypothetical protein JSV88_24570 [Candidatus Aminicenantes bacterium]|nr:MAG: hypothetical protein JSV88_24570 [Candidatus Aminicenantes bacterium]